MPSTLATSSGRGADGAGEAWAQATSIKGRSHRWVMTLQSRSPPRGAIAALLGAADPLVVEETALALVQQVLEDAGGERRAASGARVSPARRRLSEEIQHVLATRYAERLTLDEIAAACGCSAFYASRVFRAVTGETVHRHLTRVRLHVALLEVGRSAGRLTDLALAVGFSSHSSFTAAFRAEFGAAPTAAQRVGRKGVALDVGERRTSTAPEESSARSQKRVSSDSSLSARS